MCVEYLQRYLTCHKCHVGVCSIVTNLTLITRVSSALTGELAQPSQVKGTVLHKMALTSDTSHKLRVSQATCATY